MRSWLLVVVLAACSHKSAPTTYWCSTYVNRLRERASADVQKLTQESHVRERGSEGLLALVGLYPANDVALKVCSDADGDTAEVSEARDGRVASLGSKVSEFVLAHHTAPLSAAEAKELQQLIDELSAAYTDPAPVKP
jgi:hypothetical protein